MSGIKPDINVNIIQSKNKLVLIVRLASSWLQARPTVSCSPCLCRWWNSIVKSLSLSTWFSPIWSWPSISLITHYNLFYCYINHHHSRSWLWYCHNSIITNHNHITPIPDQGGGRFWWERRLNFCQSGFANLQTSHWKSSLLYGWHNAFLGQMFFKTRLSCYTMLSIFTCSINAQSKNSHLPRIQANYSMGWRVSGE